MKFPNEASEFIFVRSYARWIEEEGRRETWEETVDRYINFIEKHTGDKVPQKVFKKIRSKILNFNVMPSMRLMWAAGRTAETTNVAAYNCAFSAIDCIESFAEALYILMCGAGYGFSVEKRHVDKLPEVSLIKGDGAGTFVIPDSKEGWADSVKVLMQSLYAGRDVTMDYSLLRPKGARLKNFGGRSSGPAPLISLHEFIRKIFETAQGRKLKSIECLDIMNKIAEIVVVGGVRRSSEISLSDLDDQDIASAKCWPFPLHRAMSNNSAVYHEKPGAVKFLEEWALLAKSGTGERGIFNLEGARKRCPERRNGSKIEGTNPCVSGDTEVLTKDGYKRIDSIVGEMVEIWNGQEWSAVKARVTGYNQKILRVTLSSGRHIDCTPYHEFILADGYSGNVIRTKALELEIGSKLAKFAFPVIEHGKSVDYAYAQGFLSAEGMDDYNFAWIYQPKYSCVERLSSFGYVKDENHNRRCIRWNFDRHPKSFVPFSWNLQSRLEWLSGLLDGDGTELKEGGVQLSSINRNFICDLQKLLTTLGVNSKVSLSSPTGWKDMPDHLGGIKSYYCQDLWRICIGSVQVTELKSIGLKCSRLKLDKAPQRDASRFETVISIEDLGEINEVFCFNEPKNHSACFNGIITGQCSEILLRSCEFCNLSEVVVRPEDDLDDILDKIETAVWMGVLQSIFTSFPYLNKRWRKNCEDERLLGVSMTGQMDNPALFTEPFCQAMKSKAIKVAKHAAKILGINVPAAITCVKPSGTVSQLVNSASGLHARFSKFYIRRYRIASMDPLYRMLKDQGVEMLPENGQQEKDWHKAQNGDATACSIYEKGKRWSEDKVNTWVVSFPIASPKGCITKDDMTALQQLEHCKLLQTFWCEQSASCTVYVRENEWFEVGAWIYKNWKHVTGISFLPADGGKYEQAPYEVITEEEYEKLKAKFPKIDYSQLGKYEIEDNTTSAKELACSGGQCDIV